MTVERDVTIVLADAEMNDEGGVDVTLVDQTVALSVAEAYELGALLIRAAEEAEAYTIAAVASDTEPHGFDVGAPRVGSVFASDGGDHS